MPSRSSLSWNASPSAQPNAAIAGDDLLVVGGEQRAGLDRGGDQRRRLAPDHVEVELDATCSSSSALIAMSMYWPSHSARHVSSYRRIRRSTFASGKPRSVRRWSAIRDRLNSVSPVLIACGTPWMRPQRRPVAALDVAVLDVVVDEREVVAELDRRRAGQRPLVLAGDAGVGEQAEQRPHPLAARRARPVEAEVVADHLVQPVGRRVAVARRAARSRPRCRR